MSQVPPRFTSHLRIQGKPLHLEHKLSKGVRRDEHGSGISDDCSFRLSIFVHSRVN